MLKITKIKRGEKRGEKRQPYPLMQKQPLDERHSKSAFGHGCAGHKGFSKSLRRLALATLIFYILSLSLPVQLDGRLIGKGKAWPKQVKKAEISLISHSFNIRVGEASKESRRR